METKDQPAANATPAEHPGVPAVDRAGKARSTRGGANQNAGKGTDKGADKHELLSGFKRFRYKVEAAALGAVARLLPLLPRPAMLAVARGGAWLLYYLLPEDRNVAYANLDIAFGDAKTRKEKARIVRSAFRNLVTTLAGLFWAPRLNKDQVLQLAACEPDNEAWLRSLHARGKGIVFITLHYGDWEMMSLTVGYMGFGYTTVAEPTKNPVIQETVAKLRSRSGHLTVPPRFAVLKLYKTLARGGNIGLLIDVNARRGRGGVWLDFFGLPVFSTVAVAELAKRTGAAIVFAKAEPLPGRRTNIIFGPEIVPDDTGSPEADVLSTSQRCLDCCRDAILARPENWLWTYKRWKRRPTPEKGRYPFYSKYDPNT